MEIGDKIRKSREMGATDEEIIKHASASDPDFAEKYSKSIQQGAKPNEILNYLAKPKEQEQSSGIGEAIHQGARYAMQAGLGLFEGTKPGFTYDIAAQASQAGSKGEEKAQAEGVGYRGGILGGIGEKEEPPIPLPTIAEAAKKGGEFIGIDTEPRNKSEKFVRQAFNLRMLGDKAVGWGVKQGSFLMKELQAVAKTAPLIATATAAKDISGIPEWATFAVMALGVPAAIQGGKNLLREGANLLQRKALFDVRNIDFRPTRIIDSFKQEWGNARREALDNLRSGAFTADQYNKVKPFLDIASERNIPVNLGAFTDSATIKNVERIAKKRGLEGEALNTFIQKSAESWANQAEDLSRRISQTHRFSQQGEVADALLSDVTRKKQQGLIKEYQDLYGASEKGFANTEALPVDEVNSLGKSLSSVVNGTSGSLIPTAAEKSTANIARKAEKGLHISAKEAGRPELAFVKMETGAAEKAATIEGAGQKVNESIQSFDKAKILHKEASQDVSNLTKSVAEKQKAFEEAKKAHVEARRKVHDNQKQRGKGKARREKIATLDELQKVATEAKETEKELAESLKAESQALKTAKEAEKAAQEELGVARKTAEGAGIKKEERLIQTQEDFDAIFQDEAKNMKFDPETGEIRFVKPINAQNLVKTIRSLHQYLEWDHPATKNMLKPFLNQVKTTLGRVYGKSHPQAYEEYLKGNEKFKEAIGIFGEDAAFKKWGIKSTSTPEELLKTVDSFSRFKQFEKTFGGTPEGKQMIDELKRLKVKERLEPVFDNWKPGKVNKALNKLLRDPTFQYMLPKEVRTDLKRLKDLDARLEVTSRDIYSLPSTPANEETKQLIGLVMKFIDPTAAILTLGASKGIAKVSKRATDAYADILFNPNVTHEIVRIGEDTLKAASNPKTSPGVIKRLLADAELLKDTIVQSEAVVAASVAAGRQKEKD